MSCEVMNPSFLSQLGHNGIDKGVPSPSFLPRRNELSFPVPRNLFAYLQKKTIIDLNHNSAPHNM